MKYAVINFSGNVGKSTVAKHVLFPRVPGAELITIETINADEGGGTAIRGNQFGALQEQLLLVDNAIIDIGASNVEDVMKLMSQYRGAHDDFDVFVVPTIKAAKVSRDTIATIDALAALGVPASKIVVVFNQLEADETVASAFYPLLAYHEAEKTFTLRTEAAIQASEVFQRLGVLGVTLPEVVADQTDWRAALKSDDPDEKRRAAAMITTKRLALSASENLDAVFAAISSKRGRA